MVTRDRDLDLRIRALVEGAREVEQLQREVQDLQRQAGRETPDSTRRWRRGVRESARAGEQFQRTLRNLRGAFAALGIGLAVRRLQRFATAQLEAADALNTTAENIGVTNEALQEYRFTARQANVDTGLLDSSLQRYSRRLGQARRDQGELNGVLRDYDIALVDTNGQARTSEQILRDLADAVQSVEDPTERLRIANRAFGREGEDLVAILRQGSAGLDEYARQAREAGEVIDGEVVANAAQFNQQLGNFFESLSRNIQAGFLEAFVDQSGEMRETITDPQMQEGLRTLGELLGTISREAMGAAAAFGNFIGQLDRPGAARLLDRVLPGPPVATIGERLLPAGGEQGARREVERIQSDREYLRNTYRRLVVELGEDFAEPIGIIGGRTLQELEDEIRETEQRLLQARRRLFTERGAAQTGAPGFRARDERAIDPSTPGSRRGGSGEGGLDFAGGPMGRAREAIEERRIELMREGQRVYDRTRTAAERFTATQRELDELLATGAISQETYNRALAQAREELAAASPEIRTLGEELDELAGKTRENSEEMSQFAIQAARSMQQTFADFLFDPFEEGVEGMARGFANAIRRMVAQAMAARIMEAFLGAYGGGSTAAASAHSGGLVGSAMQTRQVHPMAFAGARRMHTGGVVGNLGREEVPIVARRGEEVLREDNPRHRNNAGLAPIFSPRIINAIRDEDIADAMSGPAGERVIMNVIRRNPEARGGRR